MTCKTTLTAIAMIAALTAPALAQSTSTLETVKERGRLICGSSQGTPGFGAPDDNGYWRGLDVETCRAVAVAVLDDKDAVDFVPLSGQQRIPAIDLHSKLRLGQFIPKRYTSIETQARKVSIEV